MLTMIKDLPFIDSIFPVLIAAAVWISAHVFYVGAEVIGPRLAAKYYLPACQASLARMRSRLSAMRREQQRRENQQQRKKQERINNALNGLMRGVFGDEFVEHYKDDPMVKSFQTMTEIGTTLNIPVDTPRQPSGSDALFPSDYCGCVIAEQIGQRISTGLFSASLRIWKPENIRQLERLDRQLIKSETCGAPRLDQ